MRGVLFVMILILVSACEAETTSTSTNGTGGIGGKGDLWGDISEGPEADATGEEAVELGEDPYAQAKDPTLHRVVFPDSLEIPHYEWAQVSTGFSLGGTEFWQKWSGGKNPTYSYGDGSDDGKVCMYASARRFEVVMNDPPPSLVELRERSKWGGSFFNWNDDYSLSDWGDGSSARLWAWRTTLIKWISQTNRDGSCFLPTMEMVEALAADCLGDLNCAAGETCSAEGICGEDGASCYPDTEGSIQGCSAP